MRIRFALAAAAIATFGLGAIPVRAQEPAPAARAALTHTVRFGEYFYRPQKLTIDRGDSVRFVNVGKIEHTVADSTKGGTIRSRTIKPRPLGRGRSQTVRFTRPGTAYYLSRFTRS